MLTAIIQESHPYNRSTDTQVVLILISTEIDVLLQIFSSFKKAVHASAFRLVMSLMLEAIIDPMYVKFDDLLAAYIPLYGG